MGNFTLSPILILFVLPILLNTLFEWFRINFKLFAYCVPVGMWLTLCIFQNWTVQRQHESLYSLPTESHHLLHVESEQIGYGTVVKHHLIFVKRKWIVQNSFYPITDQYPWGPQSTVTWPNVILIKILTLPQLGLRGLQSCLGFELFLTKTVASREKCVYDWKYMAVNRVE